MWLSKKLSQTSLSSDTDSAQIGNLTISSSDTVAASAASEVRDLSFYCAPGIKFEPAEGQNVLLLTCSGKTVCAGVLMERDKTLQSGELCLFSRGGAKIVLKNNGDVVINDYFTVDRHGDAYVAGTVTAEGFITAE